MASPGYGDNGSVIGPANTPTSSAASGVWSLGELAEAERDDIWPAPDAITKFGLLTLPVSSHYPSTFRVVIDCDTSGNPVVLIPNGSTGNNYIVEINKSTWAFTYMRDYTLTGSGNIQLDQMGINPSDNSMIIIGTSNNGTGGMVVPNIGYLVKTGSTGWDDFQRYGTSNDGYFQGSMGGWPYTYQNYTTGGRIAFKPAAGSPSSSDDLYFSAGGRWTSSTQYFTRFGVYYNDNAASPTINGYLFQNDPSFSTLRLFDIEGNIINVNSWIECAHYVNGGWGLTFQDGLSSEILVLGITGAYMAGYILFKYFKFRKSLQKNSFNES